MKLLSLTTIIFAAITSAVQLPSYNIDSKLFGKRGNHGFGPSVVHTDGGITIRGYGPGASVSGGTVTGHRIVARVDNGSTIQTVRVKGEDVVVAANESLNHIDVSSQNDASIRGNWKELGGPLATRGSGRYTVEGEGDFDVDFELDSATQTVITDNGIAHQTYNVRGSDLSVQSSSSYDGDGQSLSVKQKGGNFQATTVGERAGFVLFDDQSAKINIFTDGKVTGEFLEVAMNNDVDVKVKAGDIVARAGKGPAAFIFGSAAGSDIKASITANGAIRTDSIIALTNADGTKLDLDVKAEQLQGSVVGVSGAASDIDVDVKADRYFHSDAVTLDGVFEYSGDTVYTNTKLNIKNDVLLDGAGALIDIDGSGTHNADITVGGDIIGDGSHLLVSDAKNFDAKLNVRGDIKESNVVDISGDNRATDIDVKIGGHLTSVDDAFIYSSDSTNANDKLKLFIKGNAFANTDDDFVDYSSTESKIKAEIKVLGNLQGFEDFFDLDGDATNLELHSVVKGTVVVTDDLIDLTGDGRTTNIYAEFGDNVSVDDNVFKVRSSEADDTIDVVFKGDVANTGDSPHFLDIQSDESIFNGSVKIKGDYNAMVGSLINFEGKETVSTLKVSVDGDVLLAEDSLLYVTGDLRETDFDVNIKKDAVVGDHFIRVDGENSEDLLKVTVGGLIKGDGNSLLRYTADTSLYTAEIHAKEIEGFSDLLKLKDDNEIDVTVTAKDKMVFGDDLVDISAIGDGNIVKLKLRGEVSFDDEEIEDDGSDNSVDVSIDSSTHRHSNLQGPHGRADRKHKPTEEIEDFPLPY